MYRGYLFKENSGKRLEPDRLEPQFLSFVIKIYFILATSWPSLDFSVATHDNVHALSFMRD